MILVWSDFVRNLQKLQNVHNGNPFRPCNVAKNIFFDIFCQFFKGGVTILLNSVILKKNIDMNIDHNEKLYIHNNE